MQSVAHTSRTVLTSFLAAANAQYRDAGLGQYQMKVARDGSVTMPHRPQPKFKPPSTDPGTSAAAQAGEGAAATTGATGASPAPAAAVTRSGPAPALRGKATADGFQLQWASVQGAKEYGIWQDGVLLGHVPKPSFVGTLAKGAAGVIQVDARRADGTRTALSTPMRAVRSADGTVELQEPGQAASAPTGATAPAAPAG